MQLNKKILSVSSNQSLISIFVLDVNQGMHDHIGFVREATLETREAALSKALKFVAEVASIITEFKAFYLVPSFIKSVGDMMIQLRSIEPQYKFQTLEIDAAKKDATGLAKELKQVLGATKDLFLTYTEQQLIALISDKTPSTHATQALFSFFTDVFKQFESISPYGTDLIVPFYQVRDLAVEELQKKFFSDKSKLSAFHKIVYTHDSDYFRSLISVNTSKKGATNATQTIKAKSDRHPQPLQIVVTNPAGKVSPPLSTASPLKSGSSDEQQRHCQSAPTSRKTSPSRASKESTPNSSGSSRTSTVSRSFRKPVQQLDVAALKQLLIDAVNKNIIRLTKSSELTKDAKSKLESEIKNLALSFRGVEALAKNRLILQLLQVNRAEKPSKDFFIPATTVHTLLKS